MGTRADFYIGKGKDSEWIGSIAYDGYPEGIPDEILVFDGDSGGFESLIKEFLYTRDDATLPVQGWPWPWEDSSTTDYAYAYADGCVWISIGYPRQYWVSYADYSRIMEEKGDEDEIETRGLEESEFPDMRSKQNVTFGKRSGLLIISSKMGG